MSETQKSETQDTAETFDAGTVRAMTRVQPPPRANEIKKSIITMAKQRSNGACFDQLSMNEISWLVKLNFQVMQIHSEGYPKYRWLVMW